MPKQKPHKGLAKRVKLTAKGKVKCRRGYAGHLMSTKNGSTCRKLRKPLVLTGADARRVRRALAKG